ncbi:hypothetical protein WHR41_07309 [Cladosporium halotolerans]|uniref:Uncharacterized protein n=1 Tax=Cladosporium halotolerans TaxID=1052096 RepID=A0AB34KJA8_9PEZI
MACTLTTGHAARIAARKNKWAQSTSGLADTYLQANLLVLPSRYAEAFRQLCARNPVPCPLIAESTNPGDFAMLKSHLPQVRDEDLAADLDLRTDCPRYNVYADGKLVHTAVNDILSQWTSDHVAFVIGCSQSFESALIRAGVEIRHLNQQRTVPMYRTKLPLNPSGIFTSSTYVVSMRPFRKQDIELVRRITRRYLPTHGEPIAWGWDALERLGIIDIDDVQWGHPPLTQDGRPLHEVFGDSENVPVFWGCGVTPQEAVMKAALEGTIMAHHPGEMLVMDCREDDVL